jgi:hypothetical protein
MRAHRPTSTRLRRRIAYATVGAVVAALLAGGLSTAWGAETNLAVGRPATGSASCNGDEAPGKAVNGSRTAGRSDKWCSAAAAAFLQIDLQSPQRLGRFVVQHASSGGENPAWNTRDFSLSVSTDGATFSTVASVTGNTAGTTTHTVAAVTARFIRLDVTRPTGTADRAARLYEVEAYAAATPTPTATVTPTAGTPAPTATTAAPGPTTTAPTAAPTTGVPTTGAPKPTPAPTACAASAPETITDYVGDHGDALTRSTCNADVAIYFDAGLRSVPATDTAWVAPFTTQVWRYMKDAYGSCAVPRPACERFGEPIPAMVFLHKPADNGGGGTIRYRFDASTGNRPTIDVRSGSWKQSNANLHDVIVHEGCHHPELDSQGMLGSPAFTMWGDSKWAEFCIYDFYVNTGRTADADRVFKQFSAARDNLPPGAQSAAWFRDWFYPLWQEGGGKPAVMQRFFELCAKNFPSTDHGSYGGYKRRMNIGEYVHFTSGAIGTDLSARAATAFNSGFDRTQFDKARKDFPGVTY